MELLLPMAARKLDLSFNIELDVPTCMIFPLAHELGLTPIHIGVYADYARIRQGGWTLQSLAHNISHVCSLDEPDWKCCQVHLGRISESHMLS